MTKSKKLKVEFAPGCFDSWDGTQEELDELVKHITALAASGELDEHSQPVTEETLAELDPEERDILLTALKQETHKRSLQ